jgi:spore maturation protein CgeB
VDVGTNQRLIRESIIAPAIQSRWQCDNGYIPCRIFKNISYGKMGITNNETVYDLFDKQIIYDPDINEALKKGLQFERSSPDTRKDAILQLMKTVRDNHTYLNRISTILQCFTTMLR